VEAGTVIINDVRTHGAAETPWFGERAAWESRTRSTACANLSAKHINWDLLPMKTNLWWFPTREEAARFQRLMNLLHKWGLKKWI
jgi:hypothetical protein